MASQDTAPQGPPYPSQAAQLGGQPTIPIDVPISSVLIALFAAAAASHMTIFQLNNRRAHKFIPSAATFGFCMARIVANALRIAWAVHPQNVRLVIAANIFASAGVILLFILNLLFTQRVVRAFQPRIGWTRPFGYLFRFFWFACAGMLVMVIVAVVYSSYTRDPAALARIRDVQLTAITFLAVLSFLPIPFVLFSILLPHAKPIDKFGAGRMRTKITLLLFTSTLLCFGASFRTAVFFMPRPAAAPAWYHQRAVYYVVNYAIELIVVYAYLLLRFDRRFHIPNGSSAPGHYSGGGPKGDKGAGDSIDPSDVDLGGLRPPGTADEQRLMESAWEERAREEQGMRGAS